MPPKAGARPGEALLRAACEGIQGEEVVHLTNKKPVYKTPAKPTSGFSGNSHQRRKARREPRHEEYVVRARENAARHAGRS